VNLALDPFFREKSAWLALYEATRLSIAHSSVIIFS
jgi:hypothetical protein